MKSLIKIIIAISVSVLLSSCATMNPNDVVLNRGLPSDLIVIHQPEPVQTVTVQHGEVVIK